MTKAEVLKTTTTLQTQIAELFGPLPIDLIQTFQDIRNYIVQTKEKDKTNS